MWVLMGYCVLACVACIALAAAQGRVGALDGNGTVKPCIFTISNGRSYG